MSDSWIRSGVGGARLAAFALVLAVSWSPEASEKTLRWTSATENGLFRVTLFPEDGVIPIGRFHPWTVRVADGDGRPVDSARIEIGGGMEAHGHGLPTAPIARPGRQAGEYRVEGLKLTMSGEWTLEIVVRRAGAADRVRFRVDVESHGATATLSEAQKDILVTLSLRSLEFPPPAPSNRIADHPRAAELGRLLFFDPRLSANGEVSCATCHRPERYFTDGLARSKGTGTTLRNAPTVVGSASQSWFYWDGRRDSLWSQALIPLEAPEEMGGSRAAVVRLLVEDDDYLERYRELFGESPPAKDAAPGEVNRAFANVGKAIAAYERTLAPPPSRFDRYVDTLVDRGDEAASKVLTAEEVAGAKLFIDVDRTQCLQCHNGPMLTNGSFHNIGTGRFTGDRLDFGRVFGIRAVRMDEFNCLGPYSDAAPDECMELRFLNVDAHVPLEGAFKVPSLRNVAATAPYMHDGSIATLDGVMAHYRHPPTDEARPHELRPLELSDEQIAQLVAFLRTLGPE